MTNIHYIKNETENLTAAQRGGSIYITKDGKEKCIKKYELKGKLNEIRI